MNILLLTINYPYKSGEDFLQNELKYWSEYLVSNKSTCLSIIPINHNGNMRQVPHSINVCAGVGFDLFCLPYALFNVIKLFCRELRQIGITVALFNIHRLVKQSLLIFIRVIQLSCPTKAADVIYCYWNDIDFYAVSILKKIRPHLKLVSRMHGIDIYKDQRPNQYMPFKKQLVNRANAIFVLSEAASIYLLSNYQFPAHKIKITSLGVSQQNFIVKPSPENSLKVLTISSCLLVKQLDLLFEALLLLKRTFRDVTIDWTHIGDGPLLETYRERAKIHSHEVNILFLGRLEFPDILRHLLKNSYDVFVNCSKSEGMPVSIMEAMSFGIPVVAPNIGSIAYSVSGSTALLLPSVLKPIDIADVLSSHLSYFKSTDIRIKTQIFSQEHFDAEVNYKKFISNIVAL